METWNKLLKKLQKIHLNLHWDRVASPLKVAHDLDQIYLIYSVKLAPSKFKKAPSILPHGSMRVWGMLSRLPTLSHHF